jgi:hypothetical protein
VSLGERMALFGLVFGGLSYVYTRTGWWKPKGPWDRGQKRAARFLAVPVLLIGVLGLALWALGR